MALQDSNLRQHRYERREKARTTAEILGFSMPSVESGCERFQSDTSGCVPIACRASTRSRSAGGRRFGRCVNGDRRACSRKKSRWLEVADSYRTTTPRVFAFDESETDQVPHLRACSDTLIAIGLTHAAMANFGRGSQLLNFGQSSQLLENAEATSTDRRSDDRKSH